MDFHQQLLIERNLQNIDDGDIVCSAFTEDNSEDVKMDKAME